jgi:hypothetical protein
MRTQHATEVELYCACPRGLTRIADGSGFVEVAELQRARARIEESLRDVPVRERELLTDALFSRAIEVLMSGGVKRR